MGYLLVFLAALAVDLVPFFTPPAWTLMVLLMVKFDLNPWAVLFAGVPGSTLGRYVLSLYLPKLSTHVIKRHKTDDLEFLGKKLGQKTWRSWLFVFLYSLTPLSTTALFVAAGFAKVRAYKILPPFFAGKFVVDAILIFTGHYAAMDLLRGTVSLRSIISAALGLLVVCALLFIDWQTLLQKKKLKFHFRIWK